MSWNAPAPVTLIVTIGSVVAALTTINVFWGDWGWVPGKQYRAEHVSEVRAEDIAEKLDSFMATWQCDEWSEEIPDLNRAVDRLASRIALLEDDSIEHDRMSSIYYERKQERDDKRDAYDEADCERLVK